jgi:hypothetical protein
MSQDEVIRVVGGATVYRLFDVGYQIQLDKALDRLASSAAERVRPVRSEAQALQIANFPVSAIVGAERLSIFGRPVDVEVSARIFDFGVVSLRARIAPGAEQPWSDFAAFGVAVDRARAIPDLLEHHLRLLADRIGDAVERPHVAPVREDYSVFRVFRVCDASGRSLTSDALRGLDVAPLLLDESRPLSADARRELLPHWFSYYADDLTVLTWENALIIDPAPGDTDVEYILEFANAQLLELRYYDAVLDAELPRLYDRIAKARFGRRRRVFRRRYSDLLGAMQTLVADTTEVVERAENALKVTDDVYLARIYSAALEIFRGRAWRAGVDRKLTIIRETYAMLNAEAQALRSETLEIAILVLIALEIVLSLVR